MPADGLYVLHYCLWCLDFHSIALSALLTHSQGEIPKVTFACGVRVILGLEGFENDYQTKGEVT